MNIVADTRAVARWVIGPINADVIALTRRPLRCDLDEMRRIRKCFITVAERELMLPWSLTKRLVNHARPDDVTEGYAADWTVEQLREPAQRMADRIDELMGPNVPATEAPPPAELRQPVGRGCHRFGYVSVPTGTPTSSVWTSTGSSNTAPRFGIPRPMASWSVSTAPASRSSSAMHETF